LIGRFHAGVNPISAGVTVDGFADDVFNNAIREYEFKNQAVQEEDGEGV
jgi:hypothetical protein